MAIDDIDDLVAALRKRGFRQDEPQRHFCPDCGQQAVLNWVIAGKVGGRTISLCIECGGSRSYRNAAGLEQRTEDVDFDLRVFLR